MPVVVEHSNIDSRIDFCLDETEPELSSNAENFSICLVKTKSTRYSLDENCMIVRDSQNLSLKSSSKIIIENTENRATDSIVKCRKRPRVLSSSEESSEQRSRSVSPEVTYGGTPVAYKLHELEKEFLIVKVPMSKLLARPQKCSDRDIVDLLESDGDPEILFDRVKKSGVRVVGTLPKESRKPETAVTPKKAPKRLTNAGGGSPIKENSSANTPTKCKKSNEDERESLRMKLRRSTEQSNYKIQMNCEAGERKSRVSRRSNIGTPKKCGCGDSDDDEQAARKRTPTITRERRRSELSGHSEARRTPIAGRTRKISPTTSGNCANNHRDNATNDESDDDSYMPRRPVTRTLAKGDLESPQKRMKNFEETGTPRSARTRRNTRLINYNYDGLSDTLDKENKAEKSFSDDDSDGVSTRLCERRKMAKSIVVTPRKETKIMERVSTPRKTSRKCVIEKFEESTPKRTPRRSIMRKNDEPVTPTTSGRRISRVDTPSMKNLTPSMSRRTANIGKPGSLLGEARAKLHVSAVPKSLPCREEEFNDIYQFLERKLLDNNAGCIYISGVPGTGKTATVNEVVRCLKKLVMKGDLENFDFIEINGMKLSEPRQAYVQILKQTSGQTATWEQAYQILEKRFTQSSAKRPMTLLLVDELDLLCNKRQDVVYNLLDWPAKANARLVVITIANTMDLPERVLMGRVTSRLGLTRLTFQPYNHKQLQEIVMARLKDSEAFKSEAIQLVARKVAAVSGDARRALDICRRATEIAELNDGKIVTMQHVNEALTEMIASAKVQAIKHCSEMEKIFLQSVCAEVARTGVEETNFHNVYRQLESLCSFEGLKIPNVTQTLAICGRLGANRLLLCEHSRTDTQQRILLNVSSDDIHFAMQTIGVV